MTILWVSDADNTLWDTDKIYAAAQLKLLSAIEENLDIEIDQANRLDYIREVDQYISKRHHLGLRYPTELLISALKKRITGTPIQAAIKYSLVSGLESNDVFSKDATQKFHNEVSITPPLRDGVIEGLEALYSNEAIVVIATEGSITRIKRHLSEHSISHFVALCLEGTKSKAFYQRIAKLYQNKEAWSIGDQLTRDVAPAIEAGFKTIYFPGGFNPFWQKKHAPLKETITITSYHLGVQLALNQQK